VVRAKLLELIAELPPCLIGMEACSGAHHWAREFGCSVSIKTLEQQGLLTVHRARQGFVEQRTATLNRIRGLLAEFGVVLPLKAAVVRREAL
jgi:transposase